MTEAERRILINQRSIMTGLRMLLGDGKGGISPVVQTLREDGEATLTLLKKSPVERG